MTLTRHAVALFAAALCMAVSAQPRPSLLPPGVAEELRQRGFRATDLQDLVLKDDYRSEASGVRHLYLRQRWQGIEVWNGDIAVHVLPGGEVLKLNVGALAGIAKRVNATEPVLSAQQALAGVLARTLPGTPLPALLAAEDEGRRLRYDGASFSGQPATVQLVYQPMGEELR
ncbi:MAG: hypothetical protein ACK4L7_04135, partial [Flavobacteriales bacterium]